MTAVNYAVDILSHQFFNSRPDLVVSGPNIGRMSLLAFLLITHRLSQANTGMSIFISGTMSVPSDFAPSNFIDHIHLVVPQPQPHNMEYPPWLLVPLQVRSPLFLTLTC